MAKEAPKKENKTNNTYHVSKSTEDGLWRVKVGGGKVLKTFKTEKEASAYAKELSASTGRTVLKHNSKGDNKGKISRGK